MLERLDFNGGEVGETADWLLGVVVRRKEEGTAGLQIIWNPVGDVAQLVEYLNA